MAGRKKKTAHLADRLDAALGRPLALRAATAAARGVEVIPTGILGLDLALGVGGYPCGRVIEVFGDSEVGKTTLALHGLAQAQRLGYECAYIDVEKALDYAYAERIGVDLEPLAISEPADGADALRVASAALQTGARFVVLDSVAALTAEAERTDIMAKSMGVQARLMSQGLRNLINDAHEASAVLIFINQTRSKIGVVYGNPRTTTGGTALKFYASERIDLAYKGKLEGAGKTQIGVSVQGTVVKNKLAPPMQRAQWDIRWGVGVERGSDVVRAGIGCGVLVRNGSAIMFDGYKVGASFAKACDELMRSAEIADTVEAACRAAAANAMRSDLDRDDPEQDPEEVDLSESSEMAE